MLAFNQSAFIKAVITKRPKSLFANDLTANKDTLMQEIKGKSVLVIGGAGTIGSSFIKALLPYFPGKLVVVDYSENGLTELTRDLRSQYNSFLPDQYITYPFGFGGDVFRRYFQQEKFDIVACFAAHKHVRSEKDHWAIEAMIRNNVFNTKAVLDLARKKPSTHFFSVSTDKAANPVNVMGASKKMMEKVLLSYSNSLKITTARFANVAFSNGSLLDGFHNRIAKRQPIVAPSDVKRYFVSPEESGQLCLIACLLGKSSDIFFPKLSADQMMTFSFIAEQYLKALGLEADECKTEEEARQKALNWQPSKKKYPVYFFKTDTSGEKPFEEFYTNNDQIDTDKFEALGIVKNSYVPDRVEVERMIAAFEDLFQQQKLDKASVVHLINHYLPDFHHIETGKSLDQKM